MVNGYNGLTLIPMQALVDQAEANDADDTATIAALQAKLDHAEVGGME